ncbi:MAG: DNA-3-methyladenine glycosylase I [Alphaproteobacteria bacterium]|nr:DNA-3-methyladenine glycosylase I [Alphaproteobacteria bacterium]
MSYCNWGDTSAANIKYHDEEWGIPLHDDCKQFEFLMMEVMQCGLNWNMMINKREIFRRCFEDFDYDKVANYNEKDIAKIMQTEGMIKSPRKIAAIIHNAQCFQKIRQEFGSFCNYLWQYSKGKTILYECHEKGYIPVSNGLSDKISKDLKKRGFKFLGTITVYSHLQACGIINDHDQNCPRYKYIVSNFPCIKKKRYLEKQVQFFGE